MVKINLGIVFHRRVSIPEGGFVFTTRVLMVKIHFATVALFLTSRLSGNFLCDCVVIRLLFASPLNSKPQTRNLKP